MAKTCGISLFDVFFITLLLACQIKSYVTTLLSHYILSALLLVFRPWLKLINAIAGI